MPSPPRLKAEVYAELYCLFAQQRQVGRQQSTEQTRVNLIVLPLYNGLGAVTMNSNQ